MPSGYDDRPTASPFPALIFSKLYRRYFPLLMGLAGRIPIRMIGVGFPDLRYGQGPDLRGHLAGDFYVGGDHLRIGRLDDRKQFPALRIASS